MGAAWGSLACIGLPDALELRTVYLLFTLASSATFVVGAAARRLYFYAAQLPMLVPITAALVLSPDHISRLCGIAVPIYFGLMAALHDEVHRVVVSEIDLRERNDAAAAELRVANEQLSQLALHDELTGLANRSLFATALERALDESWEQGKTIAVLYLDVDRFKVVNDSLGHGAGDHLLVEMGDRIRRAVRSPDLVARFGGDEFTVLLNGVQGRIEAVAIAERITQALASPFRIGGRNVNVSASVGVAVQEQGADDASALLMHSDAAQYRAKKAGRNRIQVFDGRMKNEFLHRLDDEQQLRDALAQRQIVPWYQPVVDLHSGRTCSAEALARWHHPDRGLLEAGKFVPLAEDTGLILPLDDYILRHAFTDRAALEAQTRLRFWCNISAHQFARAHPSEQLARLLEETRCDASVIGIEITETAVLHDLAGAAHEISAARDLGIKVALDDFGVGHSSLTLLRSLPIDQVKIDRSFVRDLGRDPRDTAIVRSVLSLAADLSVDAVAEGVETPEQVHQLRDLGCRYAQGYLWAKALPLEELIARIRNEASTPTLLGGDDVRAFVRADEA
jgi:diguanylate cyclase (GGDEF)-like protein